MKIYTKTGDKGLTGLFGGGRVPKDDLRIRTYGALDELNAVLGMIQATPGLAEVIRSQVVRIQSELFQLGAELATPRGEKVPVEFVPGAAVGTLEAEIDEMEKALPPLKNFIIPGGSPAGAILHLARTVCRRAERELIGLNRAEPVRTEVLQYLNRLSDYLFVLARFVNYLAKIPEMPWVGRA